jgi:glyoxylase-like metal-dependent hydrolase (beta-lactamase superfamily II)
MAGRDFAVAHRGLTSRRVERLETRRGCGATIGAIRQRRDLGKIFGRIIRKIFGKIIGRPSMETIATDIRTWPWFSAPHGYNFNGLLITHPQGNICIDPVQASAADLEEIARARPTRVLLTNRNHVRAANLVRERTGARVAIHPADAAYARSQGAVIDDELHVGERVGPLNVVAMPGKSPGEVAFHWPERKILIVGDAMIGNPPGRCGLLREQVMDDPARLRKSVRSLLTIDFDTLLVGDGVSIISGAKDRLRELVATFA